MMRVARPVARGNTALAHQALVAYEVQSEPVAEPIENIMPIGQRCTLLELSDDKCRWPIGDPGSAEFFFCGGRPSGDAPYCGYHARIAYQPVADRRRDRRVMRV